MIPQEFKTMFNKLKTNLLDEIDHNKQLKFLTTTKIENFFEKTMTDEVENELTEEDREEIVIHMKWLIVMLMKITSDKRVLTAPGVEFVNNILANFCMRYTWIFRSSLQLFTEVMRCMVKFDEINNPVTITNPAKTSPYILNLGHLDDKVEIKVDRIEIFDHLMAFIELTFSTHMPLYVTNLYEVIDLCVIAEEVLRRYSMKSKINALKLLTNYITNVFEIECDIQLIVSILRSLAVITRDLNFVDEKVELKFEFVSALGEFISKTSEIALQIPNNTHMIEMTAHCRMIITSLQCLASDDVRLKTLPAMLNVVEFIEKILDTNLIDEHTVESLRNLEIFDKSSAFNLVKYPIAMDILNSSVDVKCVKQMSSKWNDIHQNFISAVHDLSRADAAEFVVKVLQAAEQINCKVRQLHQIIHYSIENDDLCSLCKKSYSDRESDQEIQLTFFDNSSSWISNILEYLKKENASLNFHQMVMMASGLMKFHAHFNLNIDDRNQLIAVIASPFQAALKNHKIMESLPQNVNDFFTSNHIDKKDYSHMKCESLDLLSQISINDSSFQRMMCDVIQSIDSENNDEDLKKNLLTNMTTIIVNNAVNLQSSEFTSLLKKFCASERSLCKDILCWSNGQICLFGKIPCSSQSVKFTMHCRNCDKLSSILEVLKTNPATFLHSTQNIDINQTFVNEIATLDLTNPCNESIGVFKSIINHSIIHQKQFLSDNGEEFFKSVLKTDKAYLELLSAEFQDIVESLISFSPSPEQSEKILKCCHDQMMLLTTKCIFQDQEHLQAHVLDLIHSYLLCIDDSDTVNLIYCLALLLNYAVIDKSKTKAQAVVFIFELTRKYKNSFEGILSLHRTFLLTKLSQMLMYNVSYSRTSTSQTMVMAIVEFTKRFTDWPYASMVNFCADIIAATCIPFAVKSPPINRNMLVLLREVLGDVLDANFIPIYHAIYAATKNNPELLEKCRDFLAREVGSAIKDLINSKNQEAAESALMYFNRSPEFVIEIFSMIIKDDNHDRIADGIDERFLGVLITFEIYLTTKSTEKFVNQYILLSMDDIIHFLGPKRISKHAGNIIAVLNSAVNRPAVRNVKDMCIKVWKTLIKVCDVTAIADILSTVIVSLESFIDEYPDEVNNIMTYLIIDNSSILSVHISDLFFIHKTKYSDVIKQSVQSQMNTQKLKEFSTFKSTLETLIRHLKNENADVKLKIYALKFLKESLNENRKTVNNLINSQLTMDPIVEELLLILMTNCKNNNSNLQVALAECIGELGAIEPNLRQQNFSSDREIPVDVMSPLFANEAMKVLCQSYQQKNDSKFIVTVQLGIQKLLQTHKVTARNCHKSLLWQVIPEKMRPQMLKLVDTKFKPKERNFNLDGVLFWTHVRTFDEWVNHIATCLTLRMKDNDAKSMLEHLLPSMKGNQYTTSLFLPYIILHSVEESEDIYEWVEQPPDPETPHIEKPKIRVKRKSNIDILKAEFDFVFDAVMGLLPQIADDENMESVNVYVKHIDYDPHYDASLFENNMKPMAIKVAKLICEVFDFIDHYEKSVEKEKFTCVNSKQFLDSFELKTLAKVNFECEEYARALTYIESYVKNIKKEETQNSGEIQETLKFLAKIYSKLDNVDAVIGVLAMKTEDWPLIERISVNNIIGNFHDSSACCKRIVEDNKVTDIAHVQEIVNCYVSLDEPGTALMIYDQLMKTVENQQAKISAEIRSEPLWRLSRFDELTESFDDVKISDSPTWGVQCSKLLMSFRNHNMDKDFSQTVHDVRQTLMKNLKITGSEQTAYEKNYRNIINFHLICDLEKANQLISMLRSADKTQENAIELLRGFIDERNKRMEIIQRNPEIEEPMLCFHRIVLRQIYDKMMQTLPKNDPQNNLRRYFERETGNLWNESIKVATNNKMYQQAQSYILNAENYYTGELFMLKSKLDWVQGNQNTAIKTLNHGIEQLFSSGYTNTERSKMKDKKIFAEAKLMIASYNAEAMNVDVHTCRNMFNEAIVKGLENEKLYLLKAEYLDRHLSNDDDRKIEQVGQPEQMLSVMSAYYCSLRYGGEFIYQSMPRFLSVWLDTTALEQTTSTHKEVFNKMNKIADEAASSFNSTYFYSALSQILSRICHPSPHVYAIIKKIIVKLVENHTQQVLWYIVPMLNSSVPARKAKVSDILKSVKNHQGTIDSMKKLIERFLNLASYKAPEKTRKISMKEAARPLLEFMSQNRNKFILPFEFNLQLNHVGSNYKFANSAVTIYNLNDEVDIMPSLQKPKKVIIVGSNGRSYPSLFKTQDDLRIDLRFMEVSSVLKGLLLRDPESRQRQLTTRTYSVIPMSEKAGIIEWVPNLIPMKAIISKEYEKMNHKPPSYKQLDQIATLSKDQQVGQYRKLTKDSFPSVLNDYYYKRFKTPQNYYKARLAFIKSTAAWSIIGYILGLGDRHCENILIDVCTGEAFHVDCNMLFNTGEGLSVPEVVPFRMTHNMVDAMGVLGVEGPFRRSCEIILRVLQKEKNTLLAYLRPMIYDIAGHNQTSERGESIERKSVSNYTNVKSRLNGVATKYRGTSGVSLSVEGHISFIIKEAMDENNLAGMYRGWMPWM